MRKSGSAYLLASVVLLLLAVIIFLPSGAGTGALPREMRFWGGLHNSLYNLDLAKMKWMEEKHKTDGDLPTMEDLAPYLGEWTNHIAQFIAWGVTYKITPISEVEPQSDVATLTRDVRFQIGFCRYYRAGTSYSLHRGYVFPPYDMKSWFVAFYQNNRGLFIIILFASAIGNMLVFLIKRIQNFRQVSKAVHENQNA
ncbi:MAG TPA: hypothetical protein VFV23_01695 [Verrucomicrobiae bacterium]|nr:hypothetical protein [Verrucomicrobiae bacterium]